MSARKINKQDTSSGSNDTMPFFNKIEDNKALNQLLYYVYDDEFVLMINELSSSILAYHKSINKYFSNIRILLNKMGESSYLTAIEGNCSHLENSFRKFYSNAKVVFRKMKLYRNEKFKKINESNTNNIIIEKLKNINNNKDINKKINNIIELYNNINDNTKIKQEISNKNNNQQELFNNNQPINEQINDDEINIIYNTNNQDKIKIFGKTFVFNNKNKVKI